MPHRLNRHETARTAVRAEIPMPEGWAYSAEEWREIQRRLDRRVVEMMRQEFAEVYWALAEQEMPSVAYRFEAELEPLSLEAC